MKLHKHKKLCTADTKHFLAGGEDSRARKLAYSVPCELARADNLFCFSCQSKKILCA